MISTAASRLRRLARHVCVLTAVLASALALPGLAHAGGFSDDFSSPVLDPAWTVVPGARIASGFPPPANGYSLTANPGHLRYTLDPMTHHDGFLNSYMPTFGYHSCCTHDPGLELLRAFDGDHWSLESKVSYHMPFANGRQLDLRVYWGDGGEGTFYALFSRVRDVHPFNGVCSNLSQRGPSLPNGGFVRILLENPPCSMLPGFDGTDTTHYLRLDRDGGVLTAMISDDGVTWTTMWSHDLGTQLDGLDQRVVVAGLSWFVPAGSFADYDYIRVETERVPQHFLRYELNQPEFSGELVGLRDQFGALEVRLQEAEWLWNPAEKRRTGREPEPIQRPDEHLVCYGLPYISTADRFVVVRNQFIESRLRVGRPLTLCTPASKSLSGDPGPPPDDLDHYLCYDVRGETPIFPSETLGVRDQFGSRTVRIDRARELCNPVEKRRIGRDPEPIIRPEEHLVCYRITIQTPAFGGTSVVTSDQFFSLQALRVTTLERLCVPSTKDSGAGDG